MPKFFIISGCISPISPTAMLFLAKIWAFLPKWKYSAPPAFTLNPGTLSISNSFSTVPLSVKKSSSLPTAAIQSMGYSVGRSWMGTSSGINTLLISNSLKSVFFLLRLLATMFSISGTSVVLSSALSSPKGLIISTALRQGSSTPNPNLSIIAWLVKE